MLSHPRAPKELIVLQALHKRKKLSAEVMATTDRLVKGYQGERRFHHLLKKNLPHDSPVWYDILLEHKGSRFQIDCLLRLEHQIHLFEVKNFEGEFYIDKRNWYSHYTNNPIQSPLLQLERTEHLLHDLLGANACKLPIISHVIFIHDQFTLYQTPRNLPIVLPTQMHRFINKLKSHPPAQKGELQKILYSKHISQNNYQDRIPAYEFSELSKGIVCRDCHSLLYMNERSKWVCSHCGFEENTDSAILRSVMDFHVLFPTEKIRLGIILEWCGGTVEKWVIRRILKRYLKLEHKGRFSYYTPYGR